MSNSFLKCPKHAKSQNSADRFASVPLAASILSLHLFIVTTVVCVYSAHVTSVAWRGILRLPLSQRFPHFFPLLKDIFGCFSSTRKIIVLACLMW